MRDLFGAGSSRRRTPERLAAATGLALACIAAASGPAAAQVPRAMSSLASVRGAPTLSDAQDGVVVWSAFDRASKRYRLVVREDGRTRTLPVRPRTVAFDVDLGRDTGGRLVAAYSRCEHEPSGSQRLQIGGYVPDYRLGRGCDLHAVDVDSGQERRLAPHGPRGLSRFYPSVSGSQVAYAGTRSHAVRMTGPLPHVYLQRGGRTSDLGGGTAPPRARSEFQRPGVTGVDLLDGAVAFGWRIADRDDVADDTGHSEVWVTPKGGARTLVDSARAGAAPLAPVVLGAPSLATPTALLYSVQLANDPESPRALPDELVRTRSTAPGALGVDAALSGTADVADVTTVDRLDADSVVATLQRRSGSSSVVQVALPAPES